jgi:PAS domain S-box-containing protein
MPLTDAQRQKIRECSKDDAAYQHLLALYDEVSGEATPPESGEQPLHDSRRILDSLLKALPGLFYLYDVVERRNVFVNDYIFSELGYSLSEFQAMNVAVLEHLIHPDDAARVYAHIDEVIAAQQDTIRGIQYRMKHQSGAWLWFQGQHTIFSRDADGKARLFLGISIDITRLKQAEATLSERQHFIDRIMATIPDIVYVFDAATQKLEYANQDKIHTLGYTWDELQIETMGDLVSLIHPDDREWLALAPAWYQQARDEDALRAEYRMRDKDGQWHWMYGRQIVFSRNPDGSPRQILGISHDITLRRAAIEALIESENRQKALLKALPDLMFLLDAQGVVLDFYAPEPELLYAAPEDVAGKPVTAIIPPDVAELQQRHIKIALETGRVTSCEYELDLPRQSERHAFEARLAASDANTVVMLVRDVTRYKQIIEALTDSEYRQNALLEAIPDLMFILNRQGKYLDYYASQPELLYSPPEEFLGKLSTDFLPDYLASREIAAIEQVLATRQPVNYDYQLNVRGRIYDFESRMVAHSEDTVLLIVRDISARTQAQAALLRSENREKTLLQAIPDLIFVFDRDGTYIDIHAPVPELLVIPAEQLMGKRMADVVPPELAFHIDYIHRTLNTRQMMQYEYSLVLAGEVHHFECRMVPRDEETVLCMVRDMTALRKSENREKALLQAIPDLIFVFDRDGTYLDIHAPSPELLILPPEQLKGKRLSDVMPPHLAGNASYIHYTLDTGQTSSYEYTLELKDGLHYFESRMIPRDADTVLSIVRDVTDRKQAESARLHQEGLQVALQKEQELSRYKSRLMMTVNHELRTPLAIISTNSALLERYSHTMSPEKQSSRLRQIQKQTQHIGAIMDNIHMVLEGQTERLQPVFSVFDLDDLCLQKVEALQSASGTAHHLTFTSDGQLQQVYADERLVDAIVINLLTNALKYSPPQTTVRLILTASSDGAILEVRDEGIGIMPDDLARIFEPFFRGSNTGESGGLGLGMSVVRDAVEVLNGKIDIESTPNHGTAFIVTLPGIRYTAETGKK